MTADFSFSAERASHDFADVPRPIVSNGIATSGVARQDLPVALHPLPRGHHGAGTDSLRGKSASRRTSAFANRQPQTGRAQWRRRTRDRVGRRTSVGP